MSILPLINAIVRYSWNPTRVYSTGGGCGEAGHIGVVTALSAYISHMYGPILRGRVGKNVEFGAKISISLVEGLARIDYFDWEAFSPGGGKKERPYPSNIL